MSNNFLVFMKSDLQTIPNLSLDLKVNILNIKYQFHFFSSTIFANQFYFMGLKFQNIQKTDLLIFYKIFLVIYGWIINSKMYILPQHTDTLKFII